VSDAAGHARSALRNSVESVACIGKNMARFTQTPVYDGNKLRYGMKINGPAIIEDPLTNTIVIPNSTVTVNKVGSYIIECGVGDSAYRRAY